MRRDSTAVDGPVDVWISYAGPDRPWAEWAGVTLEAAGFTVELDTWDWIAGDNFIDRMNTALKRAERVLSLWSAAYFERERFTTPEWTALIAGRSAGAGPPRLIPVRIEKVEPEPILATLVYRDLFGLDEASARRQLLAAVAESKDHPLQSSFPGLPSADKPASPGPRVPGSLPEVWNLPARNVVFTGRKVQLAALHDALTATDARMWVQALSGMGGVGKTQLAIEYAYLFAGEYNMGWWIDAERPELIQEQLAALAVKAGWSRPGAPLDLACAAVQDRLRQISRWLIIFDNAEDPDHIRPWLPAGHGHTVITSRHRGFHGLARSAEVDVFARTESRELIREFMPTITDIQANSLAEELGDLPLAVAQAAGLLAHTRMGVDEYLGELRVNAQEILDAGGRPIGNSLSLAAGIRVAHDRLDSQDSDAADLLHVFTSLASEPIPLSWLAGAPRQVLSGNLPALLSRPLARRRLVARIADIGLGYLSGEAFQMHRLTQVVLRSQRTLEQQTRDREQAAAMVAAAEPGDPGRDPAFWSAWADLLPHLLALGPAVPGADQASVEEPLLDTACNAITYLLMRGDYRTAQSLAEDWLIHWRTAAGADNTYVLAMANQVARTYRFLGRYEEAHDLHADTFERRRRVLGASHPETLRSANNLSISKRALQRYQEAYELNRDTLDRFRQTLGFDHPGTLSSANDLGATLRALGRYQEAYDLHRETLDRSRRVLGSDHPDTLNSVHNVAKDLHELGRYQEAYDLNFDNLTRRGRLLGPDHPHTLAAAHNLAAALRGMGRLHEAHQLDRATFDLRNGLLGPTHPHTLSSLDSLATDLTLLQRHQEAEDLRTIHQRALSDERPIVRNI